MGDETQPRGTAAAPGPDTLEEVSRRALSVLGRLTGLESTYLTVIDWAADEQEIRYARNVGALDIPEGLRVEWSDTLCRRALDGGPSYTCEVPVVYGDSAAARDLGLKTYVTVPVRGPDGGTFGTLCGASAERVELGADTRLVLDALAEMVALQLERERALDELERSNRELQQFASVASHDLRAPLTAIAGFTHLLVDSIGELSEEQREFAGYITGGVQQMRTLIEDLLAYARAGGAELVIEPDALRPAVDDALTSVRAAHPDLDGAVTVDTLPEVPGSRTQLTQLVQNLVGNALTYRRPGVVPKVHVHAAAIGEGAWEVVVDDNGIGIPEDKREVVFEMFRRLHGKGDHPGTGIGLAIAARIVHRHGGRIEAADSPLGGARFRFTLPTTTPAP